MTAAVHTAASGNAIASRRILRLALGTVLAMGFSQIINWPLSYIAAVLTLTVLATPLPALTLKTGLKLLLGLIIPAYLGMWLVPFLIQARWAGILIVILALYGSFHYSARGGSPILGMFMTLALTMVVTVGSVNADAMIMVIDGIAVGAAAGLAFVALAHALLPDLPTPQPAPGTKPSPRASPAKLPGAVVTRNALRSLAVVLPLVMIFLFMSSSTSYVVVMIKVASMGQQANTGVSRTLAREQIESTLWGGLGAIIAYQVMSIWSSLTMFCLVIGLACLVYGRRVFEGPGMRPKGSMWSYALMTMVLVLTPAVTGNSDVSAVFYQRLILFVAIALYGSTAMAVFDAFWPGRKKESTESG